MENPERALPQAGQAKPTQISKHPYETDGKDRRFLALALAFCVLAADTVLFSRPGAGIAVTVAAWYLLAAGYLGTECFRRGERRFLLAVNLLLGLTFALTSSWYFRLWNLGALAVLLPVHAMALSGAARRPWWQASMLTERLGLFLVGLAGSWGAVGAALTRGKREKSRRHWTAALGALAAVVMVAALGSVLAAADALFASVTEGVTRFFLRWDLTDGAVRLLWGLALTPFAFSLLYGLRRPRENPAKAARVWGADPVLFLLLLGAMDGLYLLFLGVQAAGLFGGAAFLESRGIAYSEWARSGFFQMVGVTAVNLTVLLAALRFAGRDRRGWGALRGLATALAAESFLLLCSAVWRMTLYVNAYGLSFKRCMTYWGMAMMAVFLGAAGLAVWRPGFRFCRTAFLAAVLGWVMINCVPIDYLVARDGVERYLAGESAAVSVRYLAYELSYDTLGQLERLDGGTPLRELEGGFRGDPGTLGAFLDQRRGGARTECAAWESWNLSAYLAGRGFSAHGRDGDLRP